jgi:hypothetical protein
MPGRFARTFNGIGTATNDVVTSDDDAPHRHIAMDSRLSG